MLLYHQTPETSSGPDGEFAPVPGAPKKLFLTSGEVDSLREHALYFIRVNPKGVTEKTVEQDVMAGEVRGGALASFRALVSNLFVPVLAKQHLSVWGKNTEEGAQEFVHGAAKFGAALAEAATSLKGGVELEEAGQDDRSERGHQARGLRGRGDGRHDRGALRGRPGGLVREDGGAAVGERIRAERERGRGPGHGARVLALADGQVQLHHGAAQEQGVQDRARRRRRRAIEGAPQVEGHRHAR